MRACVATGIVPSARGLTYACTVSLIERDVGEKKAVRWLCEQSKQTFQYPAMEQESDNLVSTSTLHSLMPRKNQDQ